MSYHWKHIKFAAVNAVCLPLLPSLVAQWLPDGRLYGREWVALNPTRADRRAGSFRINVESGLWADFATDDRGGDPVSLYAYINNLSQIAAARELAVSLGVAA
jgi:hypothetical protein